MKVYVVTTDEDSHINKVDVGDLYIIEGIFSTQEKADAFAALCGGEVEVIAVDERCTDMWCNRWMAVFDVKTGEVKKDRYAVLQGWSECKEWVGIGYSKGFIRAYSYVSQVEATRLVIEKAKELDMSIAEKVSS
jgi:hypothetical protein